MEWNGMESMYTYTSIHTQQISLSLESKTRAVDEADSALATSCGPKVSSAEEWSTGATGAPLGNDVLIMVVNGYTFVVLYTYTYIYIYIHTCIYIYIHIHTCIYIYIYIHTYKSVITFRPGRVCCPGKCVLTAQGQCFMRFGMLSISQMDDEICFQTRNRKP